MSGQVTLAIQPSLASPERWSVDYWYNDRPKAVYQAALLTFNSHGEAETAVANIQSNLESQGMKVTSVHLDANVSRMIVRQLSGETEEEITKHLQDYVKSAFSPLQKLSLSSLFEISNWPKMLKAIVGGSPHVLSLIVLAVLLFRGSFERLLDFVIPKELGIGTTTVLASAPLLVLATTLLVYFKRARLSNQLDRVKNWILQAVIFFGWDENRFRSLARKELAALEYASVSNILEQANQRDPSSFGNLVQSLGQSVDRESETSAVASLPSEATHNHRTRLAEVVTALLRDDFARKVQALAGMSGEPDYRPKQLAIFPLHLLISLNSVKPTILGLLNAKVFSVASSKTFHESMTIIGMMLGLFLSLLVICPALVWSTALSWWVSPLLFIFDIAASALTIFLLSWRPVAVVFKHRFLPRGLSLQECVGALNVM